VKGLTKVLIFIDWYLPGFKAGGPIQSCVNLVSHLKKDLKFYIITRNTDYTSKVPYTEVKSDSWNSMNGAQVYHLSRRAMKSQKIRTLIKEVDPDVVYVNGIYSFYFSILPIIVSKQLGYHNILVAVRGMFAQSAINVKGFKKKLFIRLAKAYKLYRNVSFHATNDAEEADIRAALGDKVHVKVATNLPQILNESKALKERRIKNLGELYLVSVARIAPEKNTKFALEVLRDFKGQGKIKMDLFGPIYNETYWNECSAIIVQIPDNISVEYKGSLEKEKVHKMLQRYHALFMPTKGENFGHIILESFTAGCPVLISDQTPWKNLAEKGIGYDIPLTDTDAYHAALTDLLQLNQEQFNILSERAHAFATDYCNDEKLVEANKALFEFE
jgi:glycosyltransferase involved in cell wall biosynthesis